MRSDGGVGQPYGSHRVATRTRIASTRTPSAHTASIAPQFKGGREERRRTIAPQATSARASCALSRFSSKVKVSPFQLPG